MMGERDISIIGTGALGSVLAHSFRGSAWRIKSLYNRSLEPLKNLAEEIAVHQFGVFPAGKQELGHLIILTVPDRAIGETAEKLAALDDDFSGYLVIHCSGSKSSAVLKAVQEKGARTASFHPIQTFVSMSVPADFREIVVDIEGEDETVKVVSEIARYLGSNPLRVTPETKSYLHAASVMASNYVTALMESAGQTAAMGGLDKEEAQRALLPLMQKSVANISQSEGLSNALSGPVARGDAATVAGHLKLLEQNPELSSLYKQMGLILVRLLKENDECTEKKLKELTEILENR